MGSFGADKVNIISSDGSTVTFSMSAHPFTDDVTLSGVEVWFPDPNASNEDDFYDRCWSGAQAMDKYSVFAQQFVARCEDGWATVGITAGEDSATPRFNQKLDVVEPLCTDRVDRPDFNPLKRCMWQFKVPCDCDRRALLDNKLAVNDTAAPPTHNCCTESLVKDVHPVKVDKFVTTASRETVQIISQDKESVTFSVSQKRKGCDAEDDDKLGWVAIDYINTHGDFRMCKEVRPVLRSDRNPHCLLC